MFEPSRGRFFFIIIINTFKCVNKTRKHYKTQKDGVKHSLFTKNPFEAFSEKENANNDGTDENLNCGDEDIIFETTPVDYGMNVEKSFNNIPLDSDLKVLVNYPR